MLIGIAHTSRAINDESDTHITFCLETLNYQAITPTKDLPIQVPRVVTGHIGTVVSKIDRMTFKWRTVTAPCRPSAMKRAVTGKMASGSKNLWVQELLVSEWRREARATDYAPPS